MKSTPYWGSRGVSVLLCWPLLVNMMNLFFFPLIGNQVDLPINSIQISAKRCPDSKFIIKVNTKCWLPRSSKFDGSWSSYSTLSGRVTRPRVKYWVEYRVEYWILADFLSIKVKFLLVHMGHSRIIIWLWSINGQKHEYLGLIRLDLTSIQLD